jgi:replicative DNA helicase
MKLSAPVYILKKRAKALKKDNSISMIEALNEVAVSEGFSSWSLLHSKLEDLIPQRKEDVLEYLNPGDLMLIAARPGLGKTTFTLEIILQAAKLKRPSYFFSLEYRHKDIASRVADIDETLGAFGDYLKFDFSDEISSDYIIEKTKHHAQRNMVIAIDYLQLLDQARSKPDLQKQVEKLKEYAHHVGCIILFISQVDRSFEESAREVPELKDVRMPNPIDLKLFNKNLFLHDGKMTFKNSRSFTID